MFWLAVPFLNGCLSVMGGWLLRVGRLGLAWIDFMEGAGVAVTWSEGCRRFPPEAPVAPPRRRHQLMGEGWRRF